MYRKKHTVVFSKTSNVFLKTSNVFSKTSNVFFKNVQCFFQNNGMFKRAIISKAQIFNNETNRYPLQERLKVS